MAQNADEAAASASRPAIDMAGDDMMAASGDTMMVGDMPVNRLLAGVGGLVFFLIFVCVGLYLLLSLAAGHPFTDIMMGTPVATP